MVVLATVTASVPGIYELLEVAIAFQSSPRGIFILMISRWPLGKVSYIVSQL
jgi:hypothetical protein